MGPSQRVAAQAFIWWLMWVLESCDCAREGIALTYQDFLNRHD